MIISESLADRLRHTFGGMIRLIMEVPALRERKFDEVARSEKKVLPSGSIKALDELLDLPHLYVLLRNVLTHRGR